MNENTESLFKEAVSEYIAKNYENSIDHLERLLEKDPQHRLASLTRGSALLKLGRSQEAPSQIGLLRNLR